MSDYFPLVKGSMREYAMQSAEGSGYYTLEILDVKKSDTAITAKCRHILNWNGEPAVVTELEIVNDGKEIRRGADTELQLPVKVGNEWIRPPRRYFIEVLDASMQTPAGKFENCLRVAYQIAEGDGGSGERYYAPGVGLVKVIDKDEANPFTHELVSVILRA